MKVLIIDGVESQFIAEAFELNSSGDYIGKNGVETTIYPAATFVGCIIGIGDYVPPAPVIDPPVPENRHITNLAFNMRFFNSEQVAIEIASIHDPSASRESQEVAAELRIMQRMLALATYIDLDRADTRGMVNRMESFGIIKGGRAAEILGNPVQEFERYNG